MKKELIIRMNLKIKLGKKKKRRNVQVKHVKKKKTKKATIPQRRRP